MFNIMYNFEQLVVITVVTVVAFRKAGVDVEVKPIQQRQV